MARPDGPGELSADIPGDEPLPVRLVAADTGTDLRIALSPRSTFELPAGNSRRNISFAVETGSGLGPTTLTLRAVGADGTVLGNTLVAFTVREPPGSVERHGKRRSRPGSLGDRFEDRPVAHRSS